MTQISPFTRNSPFSNQIQLVASLARGLRLSHRDGGERRAHCLAESIETLALKHLDQYRAAGFQPFVGKLEGQFRQHHAPRLVDRGHTTQVGAMSDSTRSTARPA